MGKCEEVGSEVTEGGEGGGVDEGGGVGSEGGVVVWTYTQGCLDRALKRGWRARIYITQPQSEVNEIKEILGSLPSTTGTTPASTAFTNFSVT